MPSSAKLLFSWKILVQGLIYLVFWTLAACVWQGGWDGFKAFWLLYWKLCLVMLVLFALYDGIRRGPTQFLALAIVGLAGIWLTFARSFANWTTAIGDSLAVILAAGATYFLMRWLAGRVDPATRDWYAVAPAHLKHLDVVIFGLLAWFSISLFSILMASPLPATPDRFTRLGPGVSIVPGHAQRWKNLRIGLALSGGGYRAAIFHSGVLQALERLGIRVTHLSTVSGGSIIGSYYAIGGDPAEFAAAVAEGRFNLKRQMMLVHNAARLPFPMRVPGLDAELFPWLQFDRLDVQRSLLDNLLFAGSPLQGELNENEPAVGQPKLMIAVTDLTYGYQFGLLPGGLLKLGDLRGGALSGNDFHPTQELSLAERVAISGAFPLAFPTRAMQGQFEDSAKRKFTLVDGGVRDNTGIELLRLAARFHSEPGMPPGWELDAILYSDASAVLGVAETLEPLALLPRLFDISDIGKMTSAEAQSLDSYNTCREPIEAPAGFAPADFFVRPEEWYARGNHSLQPTNSWDVHFTPSGYPPAIKEELIALLPKPRQVAARAIWKLYEERRQLGALSDTDFQDAVEAASLPDARVPAVPGVPEALDLREMFTEVMVADLEIFRGASTLDDTPDQSTVKALERLGKMMVYLRWSFMEYKLKIADNCREDQLSAAMN